VQVDAGSTAVYAYDAEGRRVAKTAATAGGAFEYLFDLQGRAVTEMGAGTKNVNRSEIYGAGRHLATQNVGLVTTYFEHNDWLGTERVRSSLSGTVAETCQSLPYGDVLNCSGAQASTLHFTGQMRDAETNLTEFPARYYSPAQGRWYSPDWASAQVPVPYADLHNPQSLNLYDYVGGDPTNHADADGHALYMSESMYAEELSDSKDEEQTEGQADAQKAQGQDQPSAATTIAAAPTLVEGGEAALQAAASKALSAAADLLGVVVDAVSVPAMVVLTPTQLNSDENAQMAKIHASEDQQGAKDAIPMAAKEHTKGERKSTSDKHTKLRPGRQTTKDRLKPGFKPRTPPRPQDLKDESTN